MCDWWYHNADFKQWIRKKCAARAFRYQMIRLIQHIYRLMTAHVFYPRRPKIEVFPDIWLDSLVISQTVRTDTQCLKPPCQTLKPCFSNNTGFTSRNWFNRAERVSKSILIFYNKCFLERHNITSRTTWDTHLLIGIWYRAFWGSIDRVNVWYGVHISLSNHKGAKL